MFSSQGWVSPDHPRERTGGPVGHQPAADSRREGSPTGGVADPSCPQPVAATEPSGGAPQPAPVASAAPSGLSGAALQPAADAPAAPTEPSGGAPHFAAAAPVMPPGPPQLAADAPTVPTAPSDGAPYPQSVLEDMRQWYQTTLDEEHGGEGHAGVQVASLLKHLGQLIFKQVTVPLFGYQWPHGEPGKEKHIQMLVSEEHTALCVKNTIERRQKWLREHRLPLDTLMNEAQRQDFLKEVKHEWENTAMQQNLAAEYHGKSKKRWRALTLVPRAPATVREQAALGSCQLQRPLGPEVSGGSAEQGG